MCSSRLQWQCECTGVTLKEVVETKKRNVEKAKLGLCFAFGNKLRTNERYILGQQPDRKIFAAVYEQR
ncbi:hypothetical protein Tco_1233738 [Tanacetum coccineum]